MLFIVNAVSKGLIPRLGVGSAVFRVILTCKRVVHSAEKPISPCKGFASWKRDFFFACELIPKRLPRKWGLKREGKASGLKEVECATEER